MDYHFRIYYLTKDTETIRKIKERFNTNVSVNGESRIKTDENGAALLRETERRGFIKIRSYEQY
jgi:hypothetical protein